VTFVERTLSDRQATTLLIRCYGPACGWSVKLYRKCNVNRGLSRWRNSYVAKKKLEGD